MPSEFCRLQDIFIWYKRTIEIDFGGNIFGSREKKEYFRQKDIIRKPEDNFRTEGERQDKCKTGTELYK